MVFLQYSVQNLIDEALKVIYPFSSNVITMQTIIEN